MGSKLSRQKKRSESVKRSSNQATDQSKNYYRKEETNQTNGNDVSQQVNRNVTAQQGRSESRQRRNSLIRNQRGRDSLRLRREAAKGESAQRSIQAWRQSANNQSTDQRSDSRQQGNRSPTEQQRRVNPQRRNSLVRNQSRRDSLRRRRAAGQLGNKSQQQINQDSRQPGNNPSTDQRSDSRQQGNYLTAKQNESTQVKQSLATDSRQQGNKLPTEQKRRVNPQRRNSLVRNQSRRDSLRRRRAAERCEFAKNQSADQTRSDSRQQGNYLTPKQNDSTQVKQSLSTEQNKSDSLQQGNKLAAKQRRPDTPQQRRSSSRKQSIRRSLKRSAVRQPSNTLTQQRQHYNSRQPGNNVSTEQTRSDSRQQANISLPPIQPDSVQLRHNSFGNNESQQPGNKLLAEQKRGDSQQLRRSSTRRQSIRNSKKQRKPAGQLGNPLAQQKYPYDSWKPGSNLDIFSLPPVQIDYTQLWQIAFAKNENESLQVPKQSNSNLVTEQQKKHSVTDQKKSKEKCYNPADTTLTFVGGDDDMDFLYRNYKSLRARMSCGHTVTPMSLTNWCRHLLDQGESKFVCGQTNCNAEWPYEEVCKMALLTHEERKYFENKLFTNSKEQLDIKSCPSCKSLVMRTDLNNLCVECTVCTAEKNKMYMFCWQCLREWNRLNRSSEHCGNRGCNEKLETLRNCPIITFNSVVGVHDCPTIRACPTCGFLVEHSKANCKGIVCSRCKVKFCFVCLCLYVECAKSMSPFRPCLRGTAPRQTTIPVWKK